MVTCTLLVISPCQILRLWFVPFAVLTFWVGTSSKALVEFLLSPQDFKNCLLLFVVNSRIHVACIQVSKHLNTIMQPSDAWRGYHHSKFFGKFSLDMTERSLVWFFLMCSNSLSHLFQRSQAAVGALLHGRRRPCCLPWPQVIHGGESQRRQKTWHFATDMSFCSEALLKSLVPRLNIRVYI